jgi:hypothetical protein
MASNSLVRAIYSKGVGERGNTKSGADWVLIGDDGNGGIACCPLSAFAVAKRGAVTAAVELPAPVGWDVGAVDRVRRLASAEVGIVTNK